MKTKKYRNEFKGNSFSSQVFEVSFIKIFNIEIDWIVNIIVHESFLDKQSCELLLVEPNDHLFPGKIFNTYYDFEIDLYRILH